MIFYNISLSCGTVVINSSSLVTKYFRYRCIFWNEARLVAESRDRLEPFVDLGFSNKDWKMAKRKESGREKSLSPLNPKVRFNAVRKSPLYHNCQLQAPDGQVRPGIIIWPIFVKFHY